MKNSLIRELISRLNNINGFTKEEFLQAHNEQPVVSVRFNQKKYKRFIQSENITHPYFNLSKQVPWCEDGFYLDERPQFTLDPLLHAGAYYVQEASSMFLSEVLKQTFAPDSRIKILDLCAAPGGKTTLLASYFHDALIVSNEIIKLRANILYENVTKWGAENIVVTNNDASDFKPLKNYFDLIVVDAPCSGSGLFRKDENAVEEWSVNNVQLCSKRQQRILADIHSSLKPNGILIYSTCSYSPEEDEEISDWLKDDFDFSGIRLQLNEQWNIAETFSSKHAMPGYRFWPHKLNGEGFFIAAYKKNGDDDYSKKNNLKLLQVNAKEQSIVKSFLLNEDWVLFKQKEIIRVVNRRWENDVALLQKNLYLKKAGVQTGEIKNNELVPHHELALSTIINDSIKKIELTQEQALQYLRKKEINVNTNYKGWALSTYNGFPLGWMKILHNRVNNYYPTDWRILKE